jgi:hypothetical protein
MIYIFFAPGANHTTYKMNVIFVNFCAKNVSRVGNQYVKKKTCKYCAKSNCCHTV